MIRKILRNDNEALRKVCRPVESFDDKLWLLLDDMKETLIKADGAGLAANQIGVLKRVCIILTNNELIELINPVITKVSKETISYDEGCLSVLKGGRLIYKAIVRPKHVSVEAFNRNGVKISMDLDNYEARAAQHEIDHLNGILFTDLIKEDTI